MYEGRTLLISEVVLHFTWNANIVNLKKNPLGHFFAEFDKWKVY